MMRRFFVAGVTAFMLSWTGGVIAADSSDTYRHLNLFGDVFERIRADYVEETNDKEMIEAAIKGMLAALDPHSSYLNAETYKEMQVQTRGEFGGLGIEVSMENGLVKVISPIEDTPAFRAGIKPGDLITQLDNEPVLGMTLQDAVKKMRGPVNTEIVITIQRTGTEKTFNVTLKRSVIPIRSVRGRVEGNYSYVRISQFNEQTESGLKSTIEEAKTQLGAKFEGVILDLRGNPGGLLEQAVAVSDAFLDQGEIVSTRGRRKQDSRRYNARKGDLADGKPVVVLINGGSASASEIVAGALQDHGRAAVLGTKTFGKGSVQTIVPLGQYGALRLTTSRYYTPSGRSIQAKGIDPDVLVMTARDLVENAQQRTEASLRGHLANPQDAAAPKAPAASPAQATAPAPAQQQSAAPATGDVPPGAEQADIQFARAVDLMQQIKLQGLKTAIAAAVASQPATAKN
ncbi:MAG: S41 family peptidase [Alphaproteobacteria bacterium]|nr:S41 family peptidase [Alphaproteobacteria bacterium]